MLEVDIRNYLITAAISGVTNNVYLEIPESKPSEFIIIQQTGETIEDVIHHSTIAIQSYGSTKYRSAQINQAVIKAMTGCVTAKIASCKLNSAYDYPNTNTKEYRYQAVFDVTHYQDY